MFAIVGMLVVLAAVIGGFLMEHGPIRVLMQPAELLIIGGAGLGTLLVANPLRVLKGVASGLVGVLGGSKLNQQSYLESLKMLYDLFNKARKEGLVAVEKDIEAPAESSSSPSIRSSSKTTRLATSCATPCGWPSWAASTPSM